MRYFILAIIIFSCSITYGQDYLRAFGVRTGTTSGFTYKKFIDQENAYEGILSLQRGIKATLLKETHDIAFLDFSDRLFYFYGFGGHFGFTNSKNSWVFDSNYDYDNRQRFVNPVLGVDVILGIEYRFVKFPFIAGLEIKPFFDILGEEYFDMHSGDLSLSVKYIIDN